MQTVDMPSFRGAIHQSRWWWVVDLVVIGVLFVTVGTLAQADGPRDSISMTVGDNVVRDSRTPDSVGPDV